MENHIRVEVRRKRRGKLVAAGTITHCAKIIGVSYNALHNALYNVYVRGEEGREYHGYWITSNMGEIPGNQVVWGENRTAAEAWDAFVEPIRKRFGLEVRKQETEP